MTPICQHYRIQKLTLANGKTITYGLHSTQFLPIGLEQACVMVQTEDGIWLEIPTKDRRVVTEIRYTLTVFDGESTLVQPLRHPVKDQLIFKGNVLTGRTGKPIFELVPLVDIFRTRRMDMRGAKGVQFIC